MARKKVPQEPCIFCGCNSCQCREADILCLKCHKPLPEDGTTCESCFGSDVDQQLDEQLPLEPNDVVQDPDHVIDEN